MRGRGQPASYLIVKFTLDAGRLDGGRGVGRCRCHARALRRRGGLRAGEAAVEDLRTLQRREDQEGPGVLVCTGGSEATEDDVVKGGSHGECGDDRPHLRRPTGMPPWLRLPADPIRDFQFRNDAPTFYSAANTQCATGRCDRIATGRRDSGYVLPIASARKKSGQIKFINRMRTKAAQRVP